METLTAQGIAAIKAGDREKARQLLAEALQQDSNDDQAWLWLSGVVDTDDEKRECLEQVLRIDPENVAANRGMALLVELEFPPLAPLEPESPAPAPAQAEEFSMFSVLADQAKEPQAAAPEASWFPFNAEETSASATADLNALRAESSAAPFTGENPFEPEAASTPAWFSEMEPPAAGASTAEASPTGAASSAAPFVPEAETEGWVNAPEPEEQPEVPPEPQLITPAEEKAQPAKRPGMSRNQVFLLVILGLAALAVVMWAGFFILTNLIS
jgi:hypothetical protein